MNLDKIFEYKEILQKELTFDEISKLYREILYNEYEKLKDYQTIHMYQILRGDIDIFTQMRKGREFDEDYLKNSIRW
jgi:hypothetical protein